MLGDSALVERSSVNQPNIALSVRQLRQDEMLDGKLRIHSQVVM